MGVALKLLILEDNPDDAELLVEDLVMAGFDPVWTRADDEPTFRASLLDRPDIVIADYRLPQFDAMTALTIAESLAPDIPVIVVSGVMGEDACAECLNRGAVDYLLKDRMTRLGAAVHQALAHKQLENSRQLAERAAREMAVTLQDLVDGAPALICLTDELGRFRLVNSAFEQVAGLSREALLGQIPRNVLTNDFVGRNARCGETGVVQESEEVISSSGQQQTYVSVRYPLKLAGGTRGVAAIYTNISRQKETERALREAKTTLRAQADQLTAANKNLQELDTLRAQFIATVSHELRTPLTSMLSYTELLADEDLAPSSAEMVAIIHRNGQRLLTLIEDLLLFARFDRGALELEPGTTDIADIIEDCRTAFLPAVRDAGLTLTFEIQPGLPHARANRRELERVLLNLLSNAVKFSRSGGTVAVTAGLTSDAKRVSIAVQDVGIGIPVNEQSRVFTRFFRSSLSENHAVRGTGLGLAICKAIVEAYDGEIRLDSTPGCGTVVTVVLPIADEPAGQATTTPPTR